MKYNRCGELAVIGMSGCEAFTSQVDYYLKEWRRHGGEESFIVSAECPRFGSGEGKGVIHESMICLITALHTRCTVNRCPWVPMSITLI